MVIGDGRGEGFRVGVYSLYCGAGRKFREGCLEVGVGF